MWAKLNGRWKTRIVCIGGKLIRATKHLRELTSSLFATFDQIFTHWHRSTFPSKIEIYESKQAESSAPNFPFIASISKKMAGNVLTFIRLLLWLGMKVDGKLRLLSDSPMNNLRGMDFLPPLEFSFFPSVFHFPWSFEIIRIPLERG
jgi:hypothetical protein